MQKPFKTFAQLRAQFQKKEPEQPTVAPPQPAPRPRDRTASQVVADIYNIRAADKTRGDALYQDFLTLQQDKSSRFYNPYTRPTNTQAIDSLAALGVDISGGINDDFIQKYAGLKNFQRTGIAGSPLAPTKKSSPEEAASYYYNKVLDAEDVTRRAEAEWDDLQKSIRYWAGRSDRNYSDDEILARVNMSRYSTLQRMSDEKAKGTPLQLNRPIGYSEDALRGVIWATRNNSNSENAFANAVNAALGRGEQYTPDATIKKRLDPTSASYNPHLQGSTVDDEAALFGVPSFSLDWTETNRAMMNGENPDYSAGYQRVYAAEQRTRAVETALKDFHTQQPRAVSTMARMARATGNTPEQIVREYMTGDYAPLGEVIDGLNRRQPVGLTRAVQFDYHTLVADVSKAMQAGAARANDLPAAQTIEKSAALNASGGTVQDDLSPKSQTGPDGFWAWAGDMFKGAAGWLKGAGETLGLDAWKPDVQPVDVPPIDVPQSEPDVSSTGPRVMGTLANAGASDVLGGGKEKPTSKRWTPEQIQVALASGDVPYEAMQSLKVPEGYGLDATSQKGPGNVMELFQSMGQHPTKHMTDAEKSRFAYIRDTMGEAHAEKYLEELTNAELNARMREHETALHAKMAEDDPIGMSAASVVLSPMVAIEGFMAQVVAYATGDVQDNDPLLTATAVQRAIRQKVPENFGDVGQFLYGTGMSIADNLISRGAFGKGALLTAYGRSAAGVMDKVLSEGGTVEQARVLGSISGAAELLTENMQMERLTNVLKAGGGTGAKEFIKGFLTNSVKSAIPEAAEETVSSVINIAADVFVRGDDSDLMKQYQAALQYYGGNEDRAWAEVARIQAREIGMDALGGAVSGAFFGGIAQVGVSMNAKMNAGNAEAAHQALTQAADIHTQEASAQAVDMAASVVRGYNRAQLADEAISSRIAPMQQQAVEALGVDPVAVERVAGAIQGMTGLRKGRAGLFDAVKGLTEVSADKQVQVVGDLLNANTSLADTTVIAQMNRLKNTANPYVAVAEADGMVEQALMRAIGEEAAGVDINTGSIEADAAIELVAQQPGHGRFALERWGQDGLLYLSKLVQSGQQQLQQIASVLPAMPTWSQTAIVAEESMQTLSPSTQALNRQIEAFAADMADADVMQDMTRRATAQAVTLRAEAIQAQGRVDMDAAQRPVALAQGRFDEAGDALSMAWQHMETQKAAAAQAMDEFNANPADATAKDRYMAVLDGLTDARAQHTKAQEALSKAQTGLQEAQRTYTDSMGNAEQAARQQATIEVQQRAADLSVEIAQRRTGVEQTASTQPVQAQVDEQAIAAHAEDFINQRFADASPEDQAQIRTRFVERFNQRMAQQAYTPQAQAASEESRAFMQRVENRFGVKFTVDDSMAPEQEAYFNPSTRSIHINPQATTQDALMGVVVHELTHDAEQSGWYSQYRDAVLTIKYGVQDYANTGDYQRDVQAKIARYAQQGVTLTDEQALAEIVAQESRNTIFADRAAVDRLIDTDPGLARRILLEINRIIEKVRAAFGDPAVAELERARLLLGEALNDRATQARDVSAENMQAPTNANDGRAIGKSGQLFIGNTRYNFHYAAIPIESAITSFDDGFPQALQPRDTDRTESIRRREGIARELIPERVGPSNEATTGAPVLAPNNVVLAGNHRMWGIRNALETNPETAKLYADYLKQVAEQAGIDEATIRPGSVLVRVLDGDVDYTDFARRSNESVTAAYSETENAQTDAAKLTPAMLASVSVNDRGNMNTRANDQFVVDFINQVIPANERGAFVSPDGQISQRGLERMRNALFQRAYADADMTAQLSEQTDDVVKNVIKAMTNVAPRIAQVQSQIDAGTLHDVGIAGEIVTAYKTLQHVRNNDLDVGTYLNQIKMVDDDAESTKLLLRAFDTHKRSAKAMTDTLNAVLDVAEEAGDPNQVAMPGVDVPAPDKAQIVQRGIDRAAAQRDGMLAGVQYSLDETDSVYLQAVEADDMDTAQKMVDEAAKTAMTNSKIRDESGKLVAVYHGTDSNFNVFDRTKTRANMDIQGNFFSPWEEDAAGYGRNVRKFYLNITNPATEAIGYKALRQYQGQNDAGVKARDYLIRLGYDGVDNNGQEYIAFDSIQAKSADPVTYDDNGEAIPLSQRFDTGNDDIRYSLSTQDIADIDAEIDRLLAQYGAIPQGEMATNPAPIPQQTSPEMRTRRFARTVNEAGVFDREQQAEFNQRLVDEQFSYEPISDREAVAYTMQMRDRGGVEAMQQAWSRALNENRVPGKRQVAVGEQLLLDYAQAGDTEGAMRMTAELAEVMTRAGQTVQAARMLKRMTNAGQLYYIERAVNKTNETIKGDPIQLNPTLVTELLNARTQQERETAAKKLYRDAGQQIPPNWRTRLQAWRYFSMLFNPTTHIRNVLGNAVFMPAVRMKNIIGTVIERATGSERTKSIHVNRQMYRAALADADAHIDILMGGGKHNPTNEIEQNRRSFGYSLPGRTMESLTTFNTDALEAEDRLFLRRHYANALAGHLQANNTTLETADRATLDAARDYAFTEAHKATYRDASHLATALNNISKRGGFAGVVVEGILPFKKTPINVLKRGVEYSPLGLLDSFTRGAMQLRRGDITQAQFIDRISSGMSGTMIAALGYFLANAGLLRGAFGDDKEDEFRRLTGKQEFALEIGGMSITLDWMAPGSMPLFVGATLYDMMQADLSDMDAEEALKAGLGALTQITEPVFNLSMLDGVNRAIEAASYSEQNAITAILMNSATNFAGQMVPTLGGKVARMFDPVRRRTYASKDGMLGSTVQRAVETAQNKVPFLTSLNEPYLNIWGEADVTDSPWLRAFENFLSPAYVEALEPDAVEDLLLEVYKQTGDDKVLPRTASKYFSVNGERVNLSSEQYTVFSQTRGRAMHSTLKELLGRDDFQSLEPRQKAYAISAALDYATSLGKHTVDNRHTLDAWMRNGEKAGSIADAILAKQREAELAEVRTGYRVAAIQAIQDGDVESVSVAVEALRTSKLNESDTVTQKQVQNFPKETLSNRVREAYLQAYDANDEALMERIEDTLAEAGIVYAYRDWLKKHVGGQE